ncbi:MAG TPA: hypothetical protein VI248_10250 [Kineosporiaceae bacterium]
MNSKINVMILVDVIGALSAGTLQGGNLCMMDDGDLASTGQGTPTLITNCLPGQLIKWSALAVDVQTPVAIKSIRFRSPDGGGDEGSGAGASGVSGSGYDANLDLEVWEGIVPAYLTPGTVYRYDVELQMYEGAASILHNTSPGLMRAM